MDSATQIKSLISQLYPTGRAWNFVTDGETKELVIVYTDGIGDPFTDGFGDPFVLNTGSENSGGKKISIARSKSFVRFFDNAVSVLNGLIADNDSFDVTDAENWERVLGLFISSLTLEERKEAILRKQAYPNGIPERAYYLFVQSQLRAAGFDVYVHENRFADGSGGWTVQDPEDMASTLYQLGNAELGAAELGGGTSGISYSIAANSLDESVDNGFYDTPSNAVELGSTQLGAGQMKPYNEISRALGLRYSMFIGGETFPAMASVPLQRKKEFRQLVLTLKQLHIVVFLLINYN